MDQILRSLLIVVTLAFICGCESLAHLKNQANVAPATVTPTAIELPFVDVNTYAAVKRDEFGNCYKAIARDPAAAILEPGSRAPVRRLSLLSVGFVGKSKLSGDTFEYLIDPNLRPDGIAETPKFFFSTSRQVWRPNAATRAHRPGCELREEAMGLFNGAPAIWVERDSSTKPSWMPILEKRTLVIDDQEYEMIKSAVIALDDLTVRVAKPVISDEALESLRQIDLLIVIDRTGSMQHAWQAVQQVIDRLLTDLGGQRFDIRIGIAGYRDYDDPDPLVFSGLTSDISMLRQTISSWHAGGGGDWPEPMLAMLNELLATQVRWRAPAYKRLLIVADAQSKCTDASESQPLGNEGRELVAKLAALEIVVDAVQVPPEKGNKEAIADLNRQFLYLTERTNGNIVQLTDKSADQISQQLRRSARAAGADAEEELQVAHKLAAGGTLSEVCASMSIAEPQFKRVVERIERRTGSLITSLGSIDAEAGWMLYSPVAVQLGVILSDRECESLAKVIHQLVVKAPTEPASLLALWELILAANVGEEVTLDEALRLRGLIVTSSLLKVTAAELSNMPFQARKAFAEEVSRKLDRFVEAAAKGDRYPNGLRIIPAEDLL